MARTTKTTHKSAKHASPPALKRPGRPPGSKNRNLSVTEAKGAPLDVTKRTLPKKAAAPAASKLNKAELEAQIVKLERTIVRLRKQNSELKQTAQEHASEAAKPAVAPAKAIIKKSKPASATKARRSIKVALRPETSAAVADSANSTAED